MSPLMQILFEQLYEYSLDRYIDGFERDTRSMELDQLYRTLSAALPESCQGLLRQYDRTLALRSRLEAEAVFQAAFAAARELL